MATASDEKKTSQTGLKGSREEMELFTILKEKTYSILRPLSAKMS